MQTWSKWKAPALLLVVVTLFFWKIVFTRQYSPFIDYDNANQAYAWDHFSASEIQHGRLPLWDPYMQGGRAFIGEMQTALFDPLKAAVFFWPLRWSQHHSGLLSIRLLHLTFVFAHILAAWFMCLLCRELGLSRFASFLAALCFSLGGFTGRVGWPNMLDSAVWLPLIFFALLRALTPKESPDDSPAQTTKHLDGWSMVAGVALGMAILAGGLHVALMDTVAVVSAVLLSTRRNWRRGLRVILGVGLFAFSAGAVQLLPSMEYSPHTTRARTTAMPNLPTLEKPPYDELYDGFVPHSFQSFLLGGVSAGALAFSPYFGVLPFLLAIIGTWRNWERPWVRYLAGLAVLAFLYTLGSYSLLHGLIYTLAPVLWMAPEAGRFIYLTHFAGAILAAFGVESLLTGGIPRESMAVVLRGLKWAVIAGLLILMAPTLIGKAPGDEWAQFSFLVFAAAAALLAWVSRGNTGRLTQVLIIALILFDLHAFNWTILSYTEARKQGRDDFSALMGARDVSNFVKSQPGLFRVHIDGDWSPNVGDMYGLQSVEGKAATMLSDFDGFWTIPKAADLLNVRYFILRAKEGPAGVTPIYQDKDWKVLENPATCPRAWLVHDVVVEPTHDGVFARLKDANFDPRRTAVVMGTPAQFPSPGAVGSTEQAVFDVYEPGHMEFRVHADSPAFVVLSEVNYPGWEVTLNGQPATTVRTDWMLRGLSVAAGDSRITLRYAPRSFVAGAILTLLTIVAALAAAVALTRKAAAKK
jgi:hypothetical protein